MDKIKIEHRKPHPNGTAWDVWVNGQWFIVVHKDYNPGPLRDVMPLPTSGHRLFTTFAKSKAANAIGLKSFDCALPQNWLDKEAAGDTGRYQSILSRTVWAYDNERDGEPVDVVERLIQILDQAFKEIV